MDVKGAQQSRLKARSSGLFAFLVARILAWVGPNLEPECRMASNGNAASHFR